MHTYGWDVLNTYEQLKVWYTLKKQEQSTTAQQTDRNINCNRAHILKVKNRCISQYWQTNKSRPEGGQTRQIRNWSQYGIQEVQELVEGMEHRCTRLIGETQHIWEVRENMHQTWSIIFHDLPGITVLLKMGFYRVILMEKKWKKYFVWIPLCN